MQWETENKHNLCHCTGVRLAIYFHIFQTDTWTDTSHILTRAIQYWPQFLVCCIDNHWLDSFFMRTISQFIQGSQANRLICYLHVLIVRKLYSALFNVVLNGKEK